MANEAGRGSRVEGWLWQEAKSAWHGQSRSRKMAVDRERERDIVEAAIIHNVRVCI